MCSLHTLVKHLIYYNRDRLKYIFLLYNVRRLLISLYRFYVSVPLSYFVYFKPLKSILTIKFSWVGFDNTRETIINYSNAESLSCDTLLISLFDE